MCVYVEHLPYIIHALYNINIEVLVDTYHLCTTHMHALHIVCIKISASDCLHFFSFINPYFFRLLLK